MTLTNKGGAAPRGGMASKGGAALASWMRGCNPRRPLGPVLGAHAQGLLLGQPSVFQAFILQHHDEVEISCTGPSNWPRRWCLCWSRRRCCWCRCTRGVLIIHSEHFANPRHVKRCKTCVSGVNALLRVTEVVTHPFYSIGTK
jgi:hypothetical protein